MAINIIVIDDTPQNLELLEDILSYKENVVRPFINGSQAIKSAKLNKPDVILLDIMMPDMDGFEVCKLFKEENDLKEIPIIFISAKGEIQDKVKAFKSGGVDYITKPFQMDEVIARVETHYKLKISQTELEKKNEILQNTLTELTLMQNQLIQSEKMGSIGTLTAGLAHEMNNPINAINSSSITVHRLFQQISKILGLLEFLPSDSNHKILSEINEAKNEIELSEDVQIINELLSVIKNGADKTTAIIDSLKRYTHINNNDKEKANIHDSIETTLALLDHRTKNNITIEKNYGNIPEIPCYPGKLNQVFMNVLVNSIDAIFDRKKFEGKGVISISTSIENNDEGEFLKMRFQDNGIGFPNDILNRIFEPFFTTKKVGSGTGLGMSISHNIIKNHGGEIKIFSEVNKGTVVTIYIPVFG